MPELSLPPFLARRRLDHAAALDAVVTSGAHIASGFATSEPSAFYAALWDHVRRRDLHDLTLTSALFLAPHPILVGDELAALQRERRAAGGRGPGDEPAGGGLLGRMRHRFEALVGKVEAMGSLITHYEELRERRIRLVSGFLGPALNTVFPERWLVEALHGEWAGRNLARSGILAQHPVHFPDAPDGLILGPDLELDIDAFVLVMTPPDAGGRLSHGVSNGANGDALRACLAGDAKILLYLNPRYPFVEGHPESPNTVVAEALRPAAEEGRLYVVETDHPVPALPAGVFDHPSDAERAIAEHVVNHIEMHPGLTRGRALQVGIGGTGVLAVRGLAESSWTGRSYTEMLEPFTWELFERGKIAGTHFVRADGTREQLDGKLVATFALAPEDSDFYDRLDGDGRALLSAASRVVVSEAFYGGLGINNILGIDFVGHVNASGRDRNPYSGFGGAAMIQRGLGRGGVAYLCLKSTHTTPEGERRSSIFPYLPRGTPVTLMGADLMGTREGARFYLVTEHGVAEIGARDQHRFVRALISVAHPDFRDELEKAAWRELRI